MKNNKFNKYFMKKFNKEFNISKTYAINNKNRYKVIIVKIINLQINNNF